MCDARICDSDRRIVNLPKVLLEQASANAVDQLVLRHHAEYLELLDGEHERLSPRLAS